MESQQQQTCGKCPLNKLWEKPIRGIIAAVIVNFAFYSMVFRKTSFLEILFNGLLYGLLALIVCKKFGICKDCESCSEEVESESDKVEEKKKLCGEIKKIISLEEPSKTFKAVLGLFILSVIASIFPDLLIFWLVANFCIFYGLINKKFPNFIFNSYMKVVQVVQGITGTVECLIPKYEEPKEKEE